MQDLPALQKASVNEFWELLLSQKPALFELLLIHSLEAEVHVDTGNEVEVSFRYAHNYLMIVSHESSQREFSFYISLESESPLQYFNIVGYRKPSHQITSAYSVF